ncbi:MAG: hypothetical protein JWM05_3619 [Acidimicrobiales bacterium]|nr:hypothetical protein [Acidimicrobiales bacterium]
MTMRCLLRGSLALLLLLAVACSGSDGGAKDAGADPSTSSTSSTSPDSTTPTTFESLTFDQIDAGASPFCGAWAKIIESGPAKLVQDPKRDPQILKDHYAALIPLVKDLQAEAPAALRAEVAVALRQVEDVARTGSDESFTSSEALVAQRKLAGYVVDHCRKG